ncbi:hypothetical protein DVH26_23165 [Paenibacillus sp. H1-7]|uniref:hypothetical protein n=1 Tax=Paenibacillus sp. H1-7 TaxID=2282849 RepID=UPI001EF9AB9B|nr:hypothetical protein [Paenibacillus sp. H1-7]ULL17086.1 hypothetical protein DVH26_23165 [Paenibacillus sp. H1-7]
MSMQYPAMQQQVLYQADPNVATTLRSVRDRMHHIFSTNVNRLVRVQTLDGNTYEGVIVHTDKNHVYLRASHTPGHRGFFGPGPFFGGPSDEAILTLVLFELLVIVLLA